MASSSTEWWSCGVATSSKNRRVLNSPTNERILDGFQKCGVKEELLPPPLEDQNPVYICKSCFSEIGKLNGLASELEIVFAGIKAKLESQGLIDAAIVPPSSESSSFVPTASLVSACHASVQLIVLLCKESVDKSRAVYKQYFVRNFPGCCSFHPQKERKC